MKCMHFVKNESYNDGVSTRKNTCLKLILVSTATCSTLLSPIRDQSKHSGEEEEEKKELISLQSSQLENSSERLPISIS